MNLLKLFNKPKELNFKVQSGPFFWRQKSAESKYAAEILWPHAEARLNKIDEIDNPLEFDINSIEPDTFAIFLSLLGFSIESLLKGIIIQNNPEYVSNGILSSKLRNHDLIKLFELARISLSQNERIFCNQAFNAMTVESRYPIPLRADDVSFTIEIGGHCREIFYELYNRLNPLLNRI